ncbi:MAG: hypothetical protein RIT11_1151 [Pseudomonadota bacterium]
MSKQLGFKIKTARRKLNISQGDLSKKLHISASYLNLIESGKRKVSADLLIKASELLNLDFKKLSSDDNLNLVHDLQELLSDNLFEDLDITRLGDVYRKKNSEMYDKLEVISGDNIANSKATFPGEVVSDFLQENQNYFPKLEEYANKIFNQVNRNLRTRHVLLIEYLKKYHKIEVVDVVPKYDEFYLKKFNPEKKILYLSDYLTLDTKKIYCAAQIVQTEALELIEEYLKDYNFSSETAKKLTTISLINYTAAAILMPYKLFYDECRKHRYDLELLQHTFSVSFEQVAKEYPSICSALILQEIFQKDYLYLEYKYQDTVAHVQDGTFILLLCYLEKFIAHFLKCQMEKSMYVLQELLKKGLVVMGFIEVF